MRPEGVGDYADELYPKTTASQVVEETNKKFMTDAERTKLAGIETGATADQTASEILTLIKTVDGAGSGLDADTLDGVQASGFATSTHTHTPSQVGLGNVTNVAQMPISGGTFTGVAVAQNNTSYTTKQLRNVILSTADPSGGSNGDVWIKYTP